MATERYQPQVPAIQPSGPVPDPGVAEEVRGLQRLTTAADYFGQQVAAEMHRDAAQKAIDDAPKLLTRDAQGVLVPPPDVEAFGGGPIYRQQLRRSATALYAQSAQGDMDSAAAEAQALYPNDPVKVRQHLINKRDAMLQGLDPSMRPAIEPALEMSIGQATSRTMARKTMVDREVMTRSAERSEATLIRSLTGSATGEIIIADRDPQGRMVTRAAYADQINQYKEILKGINLTDAQINERIESLQHKVSRNVAANNVDAIIQSGGHDPSTQGGAQKMLDAQARAMKYADDWAKKTGEREGDRAFLNQRIGIAQTQMTLYGQIVVANSEDNMRRVLMRENEREAAYQADPDKTPEKQARRVEERHQAYREIMDSRTMMPAHQLSAAASLMGPGPSVRQAYSDLVADNTSVMNSATAADTAKAEARRNNEVLQADPNFRMAMGYQGVAAVRRINEQYDLKNALPKNIAQLMDSSDRGVLSPENFEAAITELKKTAPGQPALFGEGEGQIGWDRLRTMREANRQAYKKRQETHDLASATTENWERYGVQGDKAAQEAQRKAGIKAKFTALNAADKEVDVPYNVLDPGHLASASNLYARHGNIAPQVIEGLNRIATNINAPDDMKKGLINQLDQYREIFNNKQGKNVPFVEQTVMFNKWVEDNFSGQVRKYAGVLRQGFYDPANMQRMMNDNNEGANRLLGGADAVKADVEKSVPGLTLDAAGKVVPGTVFHSLWDYVKRNVVSEPAIKAALAPALARSPDVVNQGNYHLMKLSPEVTALIGERYVAYLNSNGMNDKAVNADFRANAILTAYQDLAKDLAPVTGPDGNPVLEYRPFIWRVNKELASRGLNGFTEKELKNIGTLFHIDQIRDDKANGRPSIHGTADMSTATWVTDYSEGQVQYRLLARDKDPYHPISKVLRVVGENDPIFNDSVLRLLKTGQAALQTPGFGVFINNFLRGEGTSGPFGPAIMKARIIAEADIAAGQGTDRAAATLLANILDYQVRHGMNLGERKIYEEIGRDEYIKRIMMQPWYDDLKTFITLGLSTGASRFNPPSTTPQAGPPQPGTPIVPPPTPPPLPPSAPTVGPRLMPGESDPGVTRGRFNLILPPRPQ